MILYGADQDICDWVSYKLFKRPRFKDCPAIGLVNDNKLICGVVYSDCATKVDGSPLSIEMSIASTSPRWATKNNLKVFFSYPFIQLGLERVMTQCSAEKPDIIAFNQRLGFMQEGVHRQAWPMGGDCISFSMLKDECQWI